jgi:hypothetical protein
MIYHSKLVLFCSPKTHNPRFPRYLAAFLQREIQYIHVYMNSCTTTIHLLTPSHIVYSCSSSMKFSTMCTLPQPHSVHHLSPSLKTTHTVAPSSSIKPHLLHITTSISIFIFTYHYHLHQCTVHIIHHLPLCTTHFLLQLPICIPYFMTLLYIISITLIHL